MIASIACMLPITPPMAPITPACENGFAAITQASFIRNFAGKLSVPSSMKS